MDVARGQGELSGRADRFNRGISRSWLVLPPPCPRQALNGHVLPGPPRWHANSAVSRGSLMGSPRRVTTSLECEGQDNDKI